MHLEKFPTDPFEHVGEHPLGRSNSEVWKVRELSTGKVYARKEFRVAPTEEELVRKIIKEMSITDRVQHKHVVKLCGSHCIENPRGLFGLLILPIADMSLADCLKEPKRINTEPVEACRAMCQWPPCLFQALNYLHSQKIRHKDIKPSNILIKDNQVYVTDFGISRDFKDATTSKSRGAPGANTWRYVAPEINGNEPRGRAADVWAMGCTVLEICTVASGNTIEDLNDHLKKPRCNLSSVYQSPYHVFDWILLLITAPGRDGAIGQHIQKLLQLTFLMLDPKPEKRIKTQELINLLNDPDSTYFRAIGQLACDACRNEIGGANHDTQPRSMFKKTPGGNVFIPSKWEFSSQTEELWEDVKKLWLEGYAQ